MEEKKEKSIEQVLAENGVYVGKTTGVSMKPFLYDGRDTVIISPVVGRLRKYDVPLYRRGDKYILHRVIKVLPDSYVICGDNCETKEYGVTDDMIVGVLSGFYRKDRYGTPQDPGHRLYAFVWCNTFGLRVLFKRMRRFLKIKKL